MNIRPRLPEKDELPENTPSTFPYQKGKVVNPAFMVDAEVADAMIHFIKSGHCVIDAGANYGNYSWLMARLAAPDGVVHAFEPDHVVFDDLVESVQPLRNVVAHKQALWCRNEEMTFFRTPMSGYSSFLQYHEFEEERYQVQARRLDDLDLPQPQFMKIDCEGADEFVLHGAEQILRRGVDCIIAEMNFHLMERFYRSERTMREYMNGLGYDCFLLEFRFKPLYLPPTSHIHLLESGAQNRMINVMFTKRERVEELWP